MSDSRKTRGSTVLLVLSVILLLVLVTMPQPADTRVVSKRSPSKVARCVRSCAHCKEMYHDHFQTELCADFCQQTGGTWNPDCGSPMAAKNLIPFFLQRLE